MSQPTKRQRWTLGAVVRIPLGEEQFGYAQMLDEPEYAFFAVRDPAVLAAQAAASPVLFRLWVMRRAHSSGRWAKIGTAPISMELSHHSLRFNQDPLDPEIIVLGYDGVSGDSVSAEACQGYERAAVWEPEHVEERLRDHRSGRPNATVQLLRPRGPNNSFKPKPLRGSA